ncbi:class I SAM-dependent methyltransferase [Oricola indica]|uniref:class I SAM-dependent methyltransferase n=1 Tax=Oricola indica TaxID=2872591 RepID=UPI003CCC199F
MSRTDRFWDRIAKRYAARPVADEASYQKKLEITRAYLGETSDVLEVGCGTGSTAILHAPRVRHIRAVDCSANMLDIAREKALEAGVTNIDFEKADIDELDLPPAHYNVVLALSILHLVDDRDAVIARLFDALKPGGVLVSSTGCVGDDMAWIRFIAPLGRSVGLLPLIRVFTRAQLRASFERAGFAIEHDWKPGKGKAVFIVGRKPEAS